VSAKIRVLIVDDSAFARKVIREVLAACPDIEVVGSARDGLEALEKVELLKPDILTLDLVMPGLDGIGLLQALPREGGPRVVVVSMARSSSELAVSALEHGAVDLVQKPTALATDRLYELKDELAAKIRIAAQARPLPPATDLLPSAASHLQRLASSRSVLAIGTSTGGPQALTRLLPRLPANFPLPIVIALHIPAGYTEALAKRIDALSQIDVQEASEGMLLRPGLAVLARGGFHLLLQRDGTDVHVKLESEAGGLLHVPSVDLLFESAAQIYGAGVLGVVLTGMGNDGAAGSAAVRRAGGIVLTESESSCVIYGMPRCVVEAKNSDGEASIDEMAATIVRRL
jgi:two-component system chemotaxis response regulator CheB